MPYAVTKAGEQHVSELKGTLCGWHMYKCPECGRLEMLRWHPYKHIVLEDGVGALTPELAAHSIELRKRGRHGEANKIVATPSHEHPIPGSPIRFT